MNFRAIICLMLLAAAGCQETPQGTPAKAACTSATACGAGLTCTKGLCVAPLPTASNYRACSIDIDCTAGDHCDLGACTHDCVSDRDCESGLTCDLRGRCATPATVNQPPTPTPPTVGAAVLHVAESDLAFASFGEKKTITVENKGESILEFRIMADQPWLSADPVTGDVAPGSSAVVTVVAANAGSGTRGRVSVVSTGGSATVGVSVPSTLSGLYQGEVHLTSPADLGNRTLAIGLAQSNTGGLGGVVDDARSPAFGFRAALDPGSATSGQSVTIKFVIPGRTGTGGNPSYPKDLRRSVTIQGTIVPGGSIEGRYEETIEGALTEPITLSGTVALSLIDRAAVPLPPQADAVVPRGTDAPTFLACDICPTGTCPSDDVQAGRVFLEAAFKFYRSPLANGTNDAYAPIRTCLESSASCYDPIALHCAQAHFYQAIQAGDAHECPDLGTGDCAKRGLLDTFKGLLVWNNLIGNEHLVRAFALGRSLEEQRTELDAARTAFVEGFLGANRGGARVWGMLAPTFLDWLASVPASTWAIPQSSMLPEELRMVGSAEPATTVAPHGDMRRLAADVSLWIQSLRSLLAARHKLGAGDPEHLALQAGYSAADAHLALGLAATLQTKMGVPDDLSKAVNLNGQLSAKVAEIGAGLNPAGFPDQYIAYTYTPALGPASNNYLKLLEDFNGRWMANANATFTSAQGIQREFESSSAQLTQQLVSMNADNGKRIADLCGGSAAKPTLARCGATSGQVFDTVQQIASANLRLQNAQTAIANQYKQIEIEQHRAAEQVHLNEVEAVAIAADGKELKKLQTEEMVIDAIAASSSSFASGLASGNVVGIIGGGAASAVAAGCAIAKGLIAKKRIDLETMAKARVEYNQAKSQLIESAARVKALMLDIPMLQINALLAIQDIGRLAGQLRSQVQDAQDAMDAMTLMQHLSATDPRRDPAFRQYRDRTTILASKAFDEAQGQLFLVTRALEYEIGMSFGRRAELFKLVTPADLASYAADLELSYQRFIATVGNSQGRETTVSLRDQVYRFAQPLQDNATGTSYAPADVFRRLLAEPRNRDAEGNVRLAFSLPLARDALFFNEGFCTDKITGIRVSLVGSALGARQPEVGLQQRGTAYLRSCTDTDGNGDYVVSEYNLENTIGVRRAIIQAGLNLSGPTDMSSGGPINTEFYGRPISAPYELIIDRNAPANANLDLTKLDDIVLFIQHETRTVH
jgi:hypothetical protein